MPMTHRNELLIALASGLAAAAAIIAMPALVAKPKMLFGRSLSAMEPSLFPYITLTLIVVLACVLVLFASVGLWRNKGAVTNSNNVHVSLLDNPHVRTSVFFVTLVLYGLILKPVGFLISSFLVISSLSLLLGNRNWIQIFLFAILCPIGLYLLATRGMLVSLPELNQIELFYANIFNHFSGQGG